MLLSQLVHPYLYVFMYSAEYDAAIEKYAEKWERFRCTYQNMPKAQELSTKMESLKQMKAEGMNMEIYVYSTLHTCTCTLSH